MAITLTKRLSVTFDTESTFSHSPDRIAFINKIIAEEKTDGFFNGDKLSTQRDFVDQAAAEEFLVVLKEWNPNRNIVSISITDI